MKKFVVPVLFVISCTVCTVYFYNKWISTSAAVNPSVTADSKRLYRYFQEEKEGPEQDTRDPHTDLCLGLQRASFKGPKRVLSFAIFGSKALTKHLKDLELTLKELKEVTYYRSWGIRVYHDDVFDDRLVRVLKRHNAQVSFCNVNDLDDFKQIHFIQGVAWEFKIDKLTAINGRAWKFLPMADETVDVFCSRHLNAPILRREGEAVRKWLTKSYSLLHVMRDHVTIREPVPDGLWCFRNEKNRLLGKVIVQEIIEAALKEDGVHFLTKQDAQDWVNTNLLHKFIWMRVSNDVVQHDAYHCGDNSGSTLLPFPSKRNHSRYAGCKRPCEGWILPCPYICRPREHRDWKYC